MAIQELTDGNTEGSRIGASATEKLGFFGLTTPIVRGTISAVGTTTATTTLNETKIDRLYAKLEALGLIATA